MNADDNFGHHWLSHCFFSESLVIDPLSTSPEREWNRMISEIGVGRYNLAIISSEDFFWLNDAAVSFVKDMTAGFTTTAVLMIRPQSEWIIIK
jgi:hypothetical protein